jgi:ASPIC and UnbV.
MTYSSGAGIVVDAMNSGAGDYDNDGDLDIYVSNTSPAPGNVLLRNEGNLTYSSVGAECGVDFFVTSWASNFADVNNDTYLDLYVSTLAPDTTNNGLFINNGTCPFTLYDGNFSGNSYASFSHAFGDYNQDGKPDLAISQASPHNYLLLKNEHLSASTGNWLKVKLEGENSNSDGIGSWIEVHDEGNKYVRYTHCGEGFMNQNSATTHVGLSNISQIDSVVVRWPSGSVDKLTNVNVNQCLAILENSFAPLPVSLNSFTAKNVDNRYSALYWSTESESNSKHYEIQRSNNGREFNTIGLMNAKINSSVQQNYEYQDQQIEGHLTYYYRLKMVDQDDSYDYSNTITVSFTQSQSLHLVSLRPNPVKGHQFMLDLEVNTPQNISFHLFNSIGQSILSQTN